MGLFQKSVLKKYIQELDSNDLQKSYENLMNVFGNATVQKNINNSKEEQFQEGFLRALFVDILGYTLHPSPNYNLITEQKNVSDSKKADGAILNGLDIVGVIELKSTKTIDLDSIEGQAFGYKNNQRACRYVIISNFRKLRFYIDNAIDYEEFDLYNLDIEEFKKLWVCIGAQQLLRDVPARMREASNQEEEKVTNQLYADYSAFRNALFTDLCEKNIVYDRLFIFKKTQKLLDRFLFLFFAEDRGLVAPNWTRKILQDWRDLNDKYDHYIPLYDRFRKNFDYLNTGYSGKDGSVFAYNGGLFAVDEVLDSFSIDDSLLFEGSLRLSNYDFDSEVDVNILGHIFEHSLNEIDDIQAGLAEIKPEKISKRKKDGVFYTPKYITKYIVEHTIGLLCKEQKEKLSLISEDFEFIDRKAKGKEKLRRETLNNKISVYRTWLLDLKIIDPACGSGAFLNQALEFLIVEHGKLDELRARLLGGSIVLSDVETSILENNIYGVDLNEEAVEIAKLSLWLRTARKGRKLNSLNHNLKCGNSLIDETLIAEEKAFKWETEFKEVFEDGGFDVVIGNPPYITFALGSKQVHDNAVTEYLKVRYPITGNYKVSSYSIFTEKAFDLLKSGGVMSYIIPNTYHNNYYYAQLREYLISKTHILSIHNLTYKVFDDAEMGFTSVPIIRKAKSIGSTKLYEISKKEDFGKGIYIETDQVKFLQAPDFKFLFSENLLIWEKANEGSRTLADKIFTFYNGIKTGNNDKFISAVNLGGKYKPVIAGKDFSKYYINPNLNFVYFEPKELWSNTNEKMFNVLEKLLIRRTSDHLLLAYDNCQRMCLDTTHLLFSNSGDINNKYLLGLLNSKFLNFLYRIIVPEIGKAFAEVKIVNLKKLPIKIIPAIEQDVISRLVDEILLLTERRVIQSIEATTFLKTKFDTLEINRKLEKWEMLDAGEFLTELKKQKIALGLADEAKWVKYFNDEKQKINLTKDAIQLLNRKIDLLVYNIYQLNSEEIAIVEQS